MYNDQVESARVFARQFGLWWGAVADCLDWLDKRGANLASC